MSLLDFKKSLVELNASLANAEAKGIRVSMPAGNIRIYDFGTSKEAQYRQAVHTSLEIVKKKASALSSVPGLGDAERAAVDKMRSMAAELDMFNVRKEAVSKILGIASMIDLPETEDLISRPDFIPSDIKEDIFADISEIQKAFSSCCFRSVAILCGRILEVALHRKYFEITGDDLLEKAPGIGLGRIVAKLSEQSVSFEPGLMQQIHLINNVRVSSVHVQHDAFSPSRQQAQAMMLYTMDILGKIFSPGK